jgi:hypothetical protein
MSVPFTRTLPYVLRDQLHDPDAVGVAIVRAVSAPDNAHVTVDWGGTNITIPRLSSYTGVAAGQSVYVLVSPLVMLALGTVKT